MQSLSVQFFALLLGILCIQSGSILFAARAKMNKDMIGQAEQFMETYSESLGRNLDAVIEDINQSAKIVLSNELVQTAVRRRYEPDYDVVRQIEDDQTIQYIMFGFTALQDDRQMIMADRDGKIYITEDGAYKRRIDNLFQNEYLSERREELNKGGYVVVPPCRSSFYDYSDEPVYVLVRSLKNIGNGQIIAYMATLFHSRSIDRLLSGAEEGMKAMEIDVMDISGQIIASTIKERVGTMRKSDGKSGFREVLRECEMTDWQIVLSLPAGMLQRNYSGDGWGKIVLFEMLLILTGGILCYLFVYLDIVAPMKHMNCSMKEVKSGDWSVRIKKRGYSSDVRGMYSGFNEMVCEIDRLTKRNLQEQMMLKDAQMAALRYQVNPHFLFNTLQTIEAIAEVYEVPEIQEISGCMGKVLRYNIRGFEIVSLREELDMIDSFMQIEKIRFADAFRYEIEAPHEVLENKILKFILQPIVENSIQHGLRETHKKWIGIKAYLVGKDLAIQVLDSGRAMSKERLREIEEMLAQTKDRENISWIAGGIGLQNVHRRLITRFGSRYGVQILYSDERGTCVQLTMPAAYGRTGS